MSVMTLKPGLLVALSTTLEGGVKYERVDLNVDKKEGDTAAIERWETTKVTLDPEEHARGVKVRGKCGSLIRSVCIPSQFGLLCRVDNENALIEKIEEAKALARAFNADSKTTRVGVYSLIGRIAQTDQEATRAIASEMSGLLTEMKAGIAAGDVEAIREAASKAKKVGMMLDDSTSIKVQAAVEEARDVAKKLVKEIVAGADIAKVVEKVKMTALDEAAFAFLDLDAPKLVSLPDEVAPALDIDDEKKAS